MAGKVQESRREKTLHKKVRYPIANKRSDHVILHTLAFFLADLLPEVIGSSELGVHQLGVNEDLA